MLDRLRNSPIPTWVNVVLVVLILFMLVQVFPNYAGHDVLRESGITIETDPDRNVLYTTAGRLLAMIAASVLVLWSQDPAQHMVVWLMSAVREAQEMFIDPFFPMADSPIPPAVDFGIHAVIVTLEVMALITVTRLARQARQNRVGVAA